MDKAQALYSFWSGFGLNSYDENTVPTGENSPEMPYITYETITDSIGMAVSMTASLWYRSTSWTEPEQKTQEIAEAISYGGKILKLDKGYLWICRSAPFAQRMGDPDDTSIKRMVLNIQAEYLTQD